MRRPLPFECPGGAKHVGKAMTVVIGVGPPIIGKACRQKGISDGVRSGDMESSPIQKRSMAGYRAEIPISHRVRDDTNGWLLIYPQTNRCTEVRKPMTEVRRSIEWINVPDSSACPTL